jgi:hypothetical protein
MRLFRAMGYVATQDETQNLYTHDLEIGKPVNTNNPFPSPLECRLPEILRSNILSRTGGIGRHCLKYADIRVACFRDLLGPLPGVLLTITCSQSLYFEPLSMNGEGLQRESVTHPADRRGPLSAKGRH